MLLRDGPLSRPITSALKDRSSNLFNISAGLRFVSMPFSNAALCKAGIFNLPVFAKSNALAPLGVKNI